MMLGNMPYWQKNKFVVAVLGSLLTEKIGGVSQSGAGAIQNNREVSTTND